MQLNDFYRAKAWVKFRLAVINDRLTDEGFTICEHCGEPIVKSYDIIAHHIEELTDRNVNDVEVALNPENIMLVHHACHNKIHNKLGSISREVYLVWGSPLSGKSTWVESVRERGDFIVDIDSIWQCVSGCERYVKPDRLKANVFAVRDLLLDQVRMRTGKWRCAYVIGGYPLVSERERLLKTLGAREVFIECTKDECIERLKHCSDRDFLDWHKFINDWWEKYTPPIH